MIQVSMLSGQTLALLRRLPPAFGRRVFAAVGAAVEDLVRRHFLRLEQRPNSQGWPKQHFWAREGVRRTSMQRLSDAGVSVTVASPAVAHRLLGGTVRPKRGRALAIPATAQAYAAGSPGEGRWPRGALFLVRPKGRMPFLATREGEGIKPQYWLVASATHRPHPDTLPPSAEIQEAARRAALDVVSRAIHEAA